MILTILLAITLWTDSLLFEAYQHEEMDMWREFVTQEHSPVTGNPSPVHPFTHSPLLYEYGFCGYIVDRDKPNALPYVQQFRQHVEAAKDQLPIGHYEMYMSAVYVFELRLHESIHPLKSMSLAKEATRLAPDDPLVLSYYGTCLFYAPKPFGNKQEALQWFEKAKVLFHGDEWQYCWVREANEMYIQQCHEKLKKH